MAGLASARLSEAAVTDAALALDPALILKRAGIDPDAWQVQVLRSAGKRHLLLCCRQAGKSTVAAGMAVYEALFRPPALVLLLSPSLRQSQELFRIVMGLYVRLGREAQPEAETSLRLELANGSRIVALPGKEETIRGYSGVSLLVLDEAARISDDLYRATRPMLAVSDGKMVALTTPWGKRGFFYSEWTRGEGWERVKITAPECKRISEAFLEGERRALPESWFRQEYLCEFSENENGVFRYDQVLQALSDDVEPLFEMPAARQAGLLSGEIEPLFEGKRAR